MIFGSYIAGACRGDTLKGKLWSVRYFFNYPGKWLCQLIMGQSIGSVDNNKKLKTPELVFWRPRLPEAE